MKVGDKVRMKKGTTTFGGVAFKKEDELLITHDFQDGRVRAEKSNGMKIIARKCDLELVPTQKIYMGRNTWTYDNNISAQWMYGNDYLKDTYCLLTIYKNKRKMYDIYFNKDNYKEQIFFTNEILDLLGSTLILQETHQTDWSTITKGTPTSHGLFYEYFSEAKQVLVTDGGYARVYNEDEVSLCKS